MALENYSALLAEIADYAVRNDSEFTANVPTFIRLAELRMWNGNAMDGSDPVRIQENEKEATVTLVGGAVDLPADYLAARNVSRVGASVPMEYLEPYRFDPAVVNGSGGDPAYYTVKGRQLSVSTSYDGDARLLYWFKPDGLTQANQNNEVFTAYPELYLAASMIEAWRWISDDNEQQKATAFYNGMVASLNSTAIKQRYGGSTLRMRPRVVV